MRQLAAAGCRDFFVANWAEALALSPLADGLSLSVLHGVRAEDMAVARQGSVRPVLNTAQQLQWRKDTGGGPCEVRLDPGMKRLGLGLREDWQGVLYGRG